MAGRWLGKVAAEAMAITRTPAGTRAVSWSDPAGRPLIRPGVQLVPAAEVQAVTACWPGAPDWTAAVNPPESAVAR